MENSPQDKVRELLNKATPKKELKKWYRGYIPMHYKRLSCSMTEAIELAEKGAVEGYACYGDLLYFTQSLILGAGLDSRFKTLVIVTTSQYGKSYTLADLAISRACIGKEVRVAGGTNQTTEIIMKNVTNKLANAHEDIKRRILDYGDRLEKLNSTVTKQRLSFQGGGLVEAVSFGASSTDAKTSNNAIGRGGDYLIDEADMLKADTLAEAGRREFSSVDGEKDLMVMISNPHRGGFFYDRLTEDEPPEDTLIIWMDCRTAYEEGRIRTKKQVLESDFFKNDSTCQRYLLCELETNSNGSMFPSMQIANVGSGNDLSGYTWCIGIDSAYKGKDGLVLTLSGFNELGQILVADQINLKKGKWIDGVTSGLIINDVLYIIKQFNVKFVCVDIGWGVWLSEGLAKYSEKYGFKILGINFGSGTTKQRRKMSHFSAKYGSNMRSELHFDMKELMESKKIWFNRPVAETLAPEMRACYAIQKGGKYSIVSKAEIKNRIGKSPDELDSCLLSVHSILLYNMNIGIDVPIYS